MLSAFAVRRRYRACGRRRRMRCSVYIPGCVLFFMVVGVNGDSIQQSFRKKLISSLFFA